MGIIRKVLSIILIVKCAFKPLLKWTVGMKTKVIWDDKKDKDTLKRSVPNTLL